MKNLNNMNSLEKLKAEKERLRIFCAYEEKLIAMKIADIKKDFPEIIANEILPFEPDKNKMVNSILDAANNVITNFISSKFKNSELLKSILKIFEAFVIFGINKSKGKATPD